MAEITARIDAGRMTLIAATGHRALRRGRVSLPFARYLLTTTTIGRMPWFADATVARTVSALHSAPGLFQCGRCLSWVLMPDHWHGIVELDDCCTLSSAMNRFKSRTAHIANGLIGRGGALWARAYHDRAIRCDADFAAALRYIALNPVRAGLASCPSQYPYGLFPAIGANPWP